MKYNVLHAEALDKVFRQFCEWIYHNISLIEKIIEYIPIVVVHFISKGSEFSRLSCLECIYAF